MNRNVAIMPFLSAIGLLVGCSDGTNSTVDAPTYIRDIQPLVQAKCNQCHNQGGIGPFPLETYEQVNAARGAVLADVVARKMPPWLAGDGCAEYRADQSLSAEQIDSIQRWVDADAPLGDPNDTPIVVTNERLTMSRVDYEIPIPAPYTPKTFPDDYRCFFLDWPEANTSYFTGFGIKAGNASILHHVIAYVVRPNNVSIFQALDDADPDPGWACFGGPGGDGIVPPPASWIGAWAPGGTGEDFPEGTGIEIPAGSKLVVQLHYNSDTNSPAPDQTKILVKTDATVQKKAAIVPFANPAWISSGMPIPAHTKDVVHSFDRDPTTFIELISGGGIANGQPLTVYSSAFHMHTLGTQGTSRIDRSDGTQECLLDVPRWDFNWQLSYTFAQPKQMAPGDQLHVECHWDNPSAMDVTWGESTTDEMCLSPVYITE